MKRKAILFLLIGLFGSFVVSAQEDMFKALFMYNFTKYLEWPSEYKNGDFVITVVGNSGLVAELEKLASKKKVGNQTIVVNKVNNASEIGKSHIVYLTTSKSSELGTLKSSLSTKPTLIVTDKNGLAKEGAGINYVMQDGKQKFEINPGAVESTGLKLHNSLVALGIKVN
jgi:hypothetical protein